MLAYDEVITCLGIKVPFVPSIITQRIERPMRKDRYEGRECAALRRILKAGDNVLELGAGVGLLSSVAGLVPGIGRVTCVEANPDLIPLIKETHRLNGAASVEVLNGVVAAEDGPAVDFYLRPNFWDSSMEPDSRPYDRVVRLSRFAINPLMAEVKPSVVVCDIEGGEMGLFDRTDLSGVRAMVIEFHPRVYTRRGMLGLQRMLQDKGLSPVESEEEEGGHVMLLERTA